MDVIVREEQPEDISAIRAVNEKAFGQPQEASVVDKLRQNCPGVLSLVAVIGDQVVGHILFSPAVIESGGRTIEGAGLAPMSVLPEHQRRGIGSKLVKAGMARLKDEGCPFVIVLGHPEYYPRFGFERASRYGIQSQWDAPDEAFMVIIMDQSIMSGVLGVARYRSEFNETM
jgi:putative acetyltransferase